MGNIKTVEAFLPTKSSEKIWEIYSDILFARGVILSLLGFPETRTDAPNGCPEKHPPQKI